MKTSDKNTQIFFDISSTIEYLAHHPHYSGIQRVVAMIISEYQKLSEDNQNLWISFLHPNTEKHCAINLNQISYKTLPSPEQTQKLFQDIGIISGSLLYLLQKYIHDKKKYYFHRTRYDIAALFQNEELFQKRGTTVSEWKKNRQKTIPLNVIRPLYDIAQPNDKLILLDSTWGKKYIKAFKTAKANNLKIITLVHDLIPTLAPNVVDTAEVTSVFFNWMMQSTAYTDFYLANSEYTKKDLQLFLQKNDIALSVKTLPLTQTGVPIIEPLSDQNSETVSDSIVQLPEHLENIAKISNLCRSLLNDKFVLHVGTIEIRKNTWRLALAWKKLLEEGHTDLPRLVFAGRRGWMNERFFDLLQATGNLYGYVTIIDHASDKELELLYKHCLFASMVSTYEGWGLPVGEALSYGKTAVVSNTTSLPEVGMDLVEYCDPLSVDSIADAVRRLIYQPEHREALENKIKSTRLRDWADVARDLKRILEANQ